jgi:N-acetylneuraminic acid mutarotase
VFKEDNKLISTEKWDDEESNEWEQLPLTVFEPVVGAAAVTMDDVIYVVGGYNEEEEVYLTSVIAYNVKVKSM